MTNIPQERTDIIAEHMAGAVIHAVTTYHRLRNEIAEVRYDKAAVTAVAENVSKQLVAWHPSLPDLEDAIRGLFAGNYAIFQDVGAEIFRGILAKGSATSPAADPEEIEEYLAAFRAGFGNGFMGGMPSINDHISKEPAKAWRHFVEAHLAEAQRAGQVSKEDGRPWIQAAVTITHKDLGVGTLQMNPDAPHRLLSLRAVNPNPANPKQTIATETFFSIADVVSITLLVAVAEDKPSPILFA